MQRLRAIVGSIPLIAVGADVIVLHEGTVLRELHLLTICSGPEFVHTYPNGDRIENVVALYQTIYALIPEKVSICATST
jgi:hypothetical protein